jgi:hypothetical protein
MSRRPGISPQGRRGASGRGPRRSRARIGFEPLESRRLLALSPLSAFGVDLKVDPNLTLPSVSTAIDAAGAVYVAGTFKGNVNFNPAGTAVNRSSNGSAEDIFVAKYGANGVLAWVQTIGGLGTDDLTGLALDGQGGVYAVGSFTGAVDFNPGAGTKNLSTGGVNRFDGYVLKLNAADGSFGYAAQLAGGNQIGALQQVLGVVADGSGNAYVTGSLQLQTTLIGQSGTSIAGPTSGGFFDGFVARLNASGDFTWVSGFRAAANLSSQGRGLALDSAGHVVATGRFTGTTDFNPGAGTTNLTSQGTTFPDVFVTQLNVSNGSLVWARRVGGSDFDVGEGVGVDSGNNIYVTGKFTSADSAGSPVPVDFDPGAGTANIATLSPLVSDVFVLKLNSAGNFNWARSMKLSNDDVDPGRGAIAVQPATGLVFVVGSFRSPGRGNEAFLAELSPGGTFLDVRTGGSTSNDVGQSVAVNAGGTVVVSGIATGAATFGAATLPAAADTFFARYSSNATKPKVEGDYDGDNLTDPVVFEPSTATFYLSRSALGNIPVQFGIGSNFGGNPVPIAADYDGDGRTDPAVFERSTATSYLSRSALGNVAIQFGIGTSFGGNPLPVPADYDGDSKTDVAVFEPSTATFYLSRSTAGNVAVQFGIGSNFGGNPTPIPADYDGDNKVDPATFEPSTSTSYLARSKAGNLAVQFGIGSNFGGRPVPVPADYDGDKKADVAVFEPSTATFYLARSSAGNVARQFGIGSNFGGNPIPTPADYDGDGKVDPGVFEPSTATSYLSRSTAGNIAIQFGIGSNFGGRPVPVVAYYDGDNKADVAVFEPSTATFYLARSSAGNVAKQFGIGSNFGGRPVPQPLPQALQFSRLRRNV